MADPGQEIVSHGMGHALGEIIVVVLLALLVKLLGLDKQWPRALAWVHGRLWARVGVTCLVLLAVVFLLAVAFDVLPTGMSCCGAAAEWVLQTTTLSFPRWVVWLAVSLAALKIWDWRYALMRTRGKGFLSNLGLTLRDIPLRN